MHRGGNNCSSQCGSCAVITQPRRRASKLVDGVIGNSRYVLDLHLRADYFPNAKHRTVISGSYDTKISESDITDRSSGPLRLGYLGRLDPTKGLDWLVEQIRRVKPGMVELLVAGKGSEDYEAALRSKSAGLPIRFLGHVAPGAFFPLIELLVAPSIWNEPHGRIIYEAYAHGIPVAAPARGGMPELIEDGCNGFILRPDSDDLLSVIQKLAGDANCLKGMRHRALLSAGRFSSTRICDEMMRFLAEMTPAAIVSSPVQLAEA